MTTEQAWAIGLFEGEGCISIRDEKSRGYVYKRVQLQLATTDEDVLQRFLAAVGKGRINGPYTRGTNKPYWVWTAARQDDVRTLLGEWKPSLGARRRGDATRALLHMD